MLKRLALVPFFVFCLSALLMAQDSPASSGIDPKVWNEINGFANLQKDPARVNSPGVEFSMQEIERHPAPEGSMVGYSLKTKNLPKDLKYSLAILRVNHQIMSEDTKKIIGPTGEVLDGPGDPHTLILMAAKGEPYLVMLTSENGKYKAATSVVPFPIETSDKKCKLNAVLLMTDAEGVLLLGKGFTPESDIKIALDSAGEKHTGNVKSDRDGAFSFVALPYKKDTKKGNLNVSASSAACSPSIDVVWGKGTYHVE
jgi:hypothetical protein